jgi:hypothetical protein
MAVWKVYGHFEYLENWSRVLDVTWPPVRGDLNPLTPEPFFKFLHTQYLKCE